MDTLEELKKQRAELDKKIEELEYAEYPFEEGDEYWYIDSHGTVQSDVWVNAEVDIMDFNVGNVFRTKKKLNLIINAETYCIVSKCLGINVTGIGKTTFTENKDIITLISAIRKMSYLQTRHIIKLLNFSVTSKKNLMQ